MHSITATLPDNVREVLSEFLESAQTVLGADLVSAILGGSAAEGRLRSTSDVNLILVLSAFDAAKVDRLREPLRSAHAAVDLSVLFILEAELPAALEAFPDKFTDWARRHAVLFGKDVLVGMSPDRRLQIANLRQKLLNLVLRLRARYALVSLRDEQAALAVADAAGPLRTSAASLLELEGRPAPSPKEALAQLAAGIPGADWAAILEQVSVARQERRLSPGTAGGVLLELIELARKMHERAMALS